LVQPVLSLPSLEALDSSASISRWILRPWACVASARDDDAGLGDMSSPCAGTSSDLDPHLLKFDVCRQKLNGPS
jgi:hypothetical protein